MWKELADTFRDLVQHEAPQLLQQDQHHEHHPASQRAKEAESTTDAAEWQCRWTPADQSLPGKIPDPRTHPRRTHAPPPRRTHGAVGLRRLLPERDPRETPEEQTRRLSTCHCQTRLQAECPLAPKEGQQLDHHTSWITLVPEIASDAHRLVAQVAPQITNRVE